MNKKLLTLTCASILIFGIGKGFCEEMPQPEAPMPPRHEMTMHHHKGGPRGGKMHKAMIEKLALTDEQKAKAEEIRKADFARMKPLMDEMKALKEKMDKMREENMKAFEEILTPEQKEKFEELKKEGAKKFHKKHGHGKHHHRAPMPSQGEDAPTMPNP